MTTWIKAYKEQLFDVKFIPYIPEDIFAIITIEPRRAARMGNGDESHQQLSNAGEPSGPRSHVYVNPNLGRSGKRKFECQKHAASIMVWISYNGEVGAPHMMLATSAAAAKKNKPEGADENNIRVRPEWLFGLPRVKGRFGHPAEIILEPSIIMNEKGGMSSGGLEQFFHHQWSKAYPNTTRE